MPTTLRFAAVVLTGCLAGLASAWWAVDDPMFDFTRQIGPWRVAGGASGGDPYGLARAARDGTIGLGPTEGVTLTAFVDGEGRPLLPSCFYRVTGAVPKDALWTIAATDRSGVFPINPAGRVGYSAFDALRYDPGLAIDIGLGPYPRTGDFIPVAGLESLMVTLRIYSEAWASRQLAATDLPTIERQDCLGEAQP